MPFQSNPLFDACRVGDIAMADSVIKDVPGAVNSKDSNGFTPLILAVYNNQPGMVDYLLQQGAETDTADAAGNTALMGACFKGYSHLAEKLIEAGSPLSQQNVQGATALTFAVTFGHISIADLLLQKGANPSIADAKGKTSQDHARMQENWEMFDLISKYIDGAN